jgi:small-conductance mechanosensitive channel
MRRLKLYLPALILTALVAAAIFGWYTTRDAVSIRAPAPRSASPIDSRLLLTAQRLAAEANTIQERPLAQEALRLSDHELDQAFATRLREAAAPAAQIAGPWKQITARINESKKRVAAGEARIAKLTKAADSDDSVAAQLELAKAQLALDQDELGDAREDLARQGGDEHASLERAIQEHEAAQHEKAQPPKVAAVPGSTLSDQIREWLGLRERQRQLEAASRESGAMTAALIREHDALEKIIEKKPDTETPGDQDSAAMIARLHQLSDRAKSLAELDKRIQDTQQLSEVYKRWSALVAATVRAVLHGMLFSLAIVFAILLAVVVVDRAIRHAFDRQADRKRRHHLRVLATVGVQLIGLFLILLVVFGPPNQLSTIIGLTTAGLTLALKDFIVAFFGWFALMGRNGIRVGDWVEIEGIGGEVIEIGVLRTVLLEMGNWTNTGHPTGRHVSFMNKFALENHYFNFSTAGQWLWDELQMTLPLAGDPYRMAVLIRERVERETEADARAAELDWERVTHKYGTRAFSAVPAVDLRPSINGLEIIVRYITRAPQRYEVKSRLFQAIVDLIHKPAVASKI